MGEYSQSILFAIAVGTISRLYMMRTDYRQYPTYLHGKTVHIALGFIAAGLGSICVPAILAKDYTALTFLTVAASQFRDVRNMERSTLAELDSYELVSRGKTYIEGIAIAFESRNYLVIMTSIIASAAYLTNNWYIIFASVLVSFALCKFLMSGKRLGELCDVSAAPIFFDDADLYVGHIHIMNVGIKARQQELLKYGMGFILTAKTFNARAVIGNLGQRQAILHDATSFLGVHRDETTASLTPLIRRDVDTGQIAVLLLPQLKDEKKAIHIINSVPVLENAIKAPN